jgi:hypothetical protein
VFVAAPLGDLRDMTPVAPASRPAGAHGPDFGSLNAWAGAIRDAAIRASTKSQSLRLRGKASAARADWRCDPCFAISKPPLFQLVKHNPSIDIRIAGFAAAQTSLIEPQHA